MLRFLNSKDIDKLRSMHTANKTVPAMLEKLIRFARRGQRAEEPQKEEGYKIKRKHTPTAVVMEDQRNPIETMVPGAPQKRLKVSAPFNKSAKQPVADKDVDECTITGMVSDFIDLTIGAENRPPKFSISISEIKEILKRCVKQQQAGICGLAVQPGPEHVPQLRRADR